MHLVAQRLTDRTHDLHRLSNDLTPHKSVLPPKTAAIEPLEGEPHHHPDARAPKARHPRNV